MHAGGDELLCRQGHALPQGQGEHDVRGGVQGDEFGLVDPVAHVVHDRMTQAGVHAVDLRDLPVDAVALRCGRERFLAARGDVHQHRVEGVEAAFAQQLREGVQAPLDTVGVLDGTSRQQHGTRITETFAQRPRALTHTCIRGETFDRRYVHRHGKAGLSSALVGSDVVATVHIDSGLAAVELASPIEGTGRSDEVLAYAQLVCTLTVRTDISGVSFTRDGRPIGIPRGDGSLSQGPLTAADYAILVTQ